MIKNIGRYIYLEFLFVKYCLVRDMEYRMNLIISFLTIFVAYLSTTLTYNVLFYNIDQIGSWSYNDVLFLVGTAAIVDGFFMSFLFFGLAEIPDMIREGTLDFMVLKPVNSMFILSLNKFDLGTFLSVIIGIVTNIIGIYRMGSTIQPGQVIVYFLLVFNGVAILYSLFFIVKCMSFYFVKVSGLDSLMWGLYEFGRRTPESIYKNFLRFSLIYICPVLVIVNFPAGFYLYKFGAKEVFVSCLITSIFLYIAVSFWKYSLKKYTSASS
ncbi:MAG: ABC transporter permease [Caulobacteraceae bacterium]